MLHDKKVFALCTAHIQNPEILESVEAFRNEARARGYYVMVFQSNMDIADPACCDLNSYSVYDLIPYTIVDVVVIMAEVIHSQTVADAICAKAAAAHVPVIAYDGMLQGYPSVYCYSNQAFSALLEHVFSVHGCRKVDLLTGIRGNYGSECMVVAYQEALRNHGIPFDATRVEYGEYWDYPAMAAVERLLALDTPEAIVCVNDSMAIAACSVLRKHGLRVPEDIIVTGSDGILLERLLTPHLTTCVRDFERMNAVAFDTAELLMAGETVELMMEIPAIVRISESCGCQVTEERDQNEAICHLHSQIQILRIQETDYARIPTLLMQQEQANVIDYLETLSDYMPEQAWLCLRNCIEPDATEHVLCNFDAPTELMNTVTMRRREKSYAIIPRADLIPELETLIDTDQTALIASVFFQNEIYGYYVYCGNDWKMECAKLPKFLHTVGSAIGMSLNAARLLALNEKILNARIRDSLTGMLNFNGAIRALSDRIESGEVNNMRLVMIAVGLRDLRKINSLFGRLEGNQALLSVANIIQGCVDHNIVTARVGGDEFMVAYFTASNQSNAGDALMTLLQNGMQSYNRASRKNYAIDIVLGKVTAQVTDALSLEGMLSEALEMKDLRRSTAVKDEDLHLRASLHDPVAAQVDHIINKNLLTYCFQPIVSAKTGQIYAYEALMRSVGEYQISPLTILQYATMMGRLYEIEWITYYNVLRNIRENEALFHGKKVFINSIPGHFITDSDFARLHELYSDLFSRLVVEFTEQAEMDGDELQQMQLRCAQNDMEIAVDDYGTGYSNISNLLRYAPNYVKIDRSLISNIHEEPNKQHFVTNIIEFAHTNGFQALAEGVETVEEMRTAIRFGVDLIQGNFTAYPAPLPIREIDSQIVTTISKISNEASKQFTRKTFMPNDRQVVHLSKLDQENYTDIFIAHPYVELVGDFGVTAGIAIKLKDNLDAHLVLQDIHLSATHCAPCILLGRNSKVTLEFRGDNRMDHGGIWVPDRTSLHLTGHGNLSISVNDVCNSAIGCDFDSCFGNINIDLAGCLQITANGDQCIGIGGGIARGQNISICGTRIFFQTSGVESISIGAHRGNCDITCAGCSINLETRVATCTAVGIQNGSPNIALNTASIEVNGSGRTITVLGSIKGGGDLSIKDSAVKAQLTGQEITIIGSTDNAPTIKVKKSTLDIACEGMRVLDIGCVEEDGELTVVDTSFLLNVRSDRMMHLAAHPEKRLCTGITEEMHINQ